MFSARSIESRLQAGIGALVLCIVLFLVLYFPATQRASDMEAFTKRLEAVGDVLAITIGVALEGHGYEGIRLAQEHVEGDPDLIGVVILDTDGGVFAAFPAELSGRDLRTTEQDERIYRTPVVHGEAAGATHELVLIGSLERVNARSTTATWRIFAIGLAILAGSFLAIRSFVRRIVAPIGLLHDAASRVAEGRLSTRVEIRSDDEIGELGFGFDRMIKSLNELVLSVRGGMSDVDEVSGELDRTTREMIDDRMRQREAIDSLSSTAVELGAAATNVEANAGELGGAIEASSEALEKLQSAAHAVSQNMDNISHSLARTSQGSYELESASNQISASMDELAAGANEAAGLLGSMSESVRHVDEGALGCGQSASEMALEAEQGARVVEQTSDAIREIQSCFGDIEDGVRGLEEKSEAVGGIAELISSIADETSLLSLNASIIAAQAGEHGASFAVVASEMKSLSNQTSDSASEVAELIRRVGEDVTRTTAAVTAGAEAVGIGFERAGEAGESLQQINLKASDSSERIAEIVSATNAQSLMIGEVEQAIARVHDLASRSLEASRRQIEISGEIAKGLEEIGALGHQARSTSQRQREQNDEITSVVERMPARVRDLTLASEALVAENQTVESTLAIFSRIGADGEGRAKICRAMAGKLLDRANRLRESIERFEIESDRSVGADRLRTEHQVRSEPDRSEDRRDETNSIDPGEVA